MPEQWLTIRFRGDETLRKRLAVVVDEFLTENRASGFQILTDELAWETETELEDEGVGLANNELTIGPIE